MGGLILEISGENNATKANNLADYAPCLREKRRLRPLALLKKQESESVAWTTQLSRLKLQLQYLLPVVATLRKSNREKSAIALPQVWAPCGSNAQQQPRKISS
ncbi:hypothetical protein QLX08_004339 [Tetragonisca angustula]|uniref:Uncharacterized protein n=1 Tax=Tetragonisca angustula TaxID=166442 RepID=A0AAW1A2B5_9HYME